MHKHILVPTDGSRLSRRAIEYGVKLAKSTGARITFLNVQSTLPAMYPLEWPAGQQISRRDVIKAAELAAGRILEEAIKLAEEGDVSSNGVSVFDKAPFEAIIATAKTKRCDLILMAAHGRRGLKGLILGSETQKVLTHCRTPLLVHR
jgi:nucleotide-binding universal stress UspA family protein